jgi:hypothetical protein
MAERARLGESRELLSSEAEGSRVSGGKALDQRR